MLQIKLFMNSVVEEIFAFKCCCIPDQNLEIQLLNTGDRPLRIHSYCDLVKNQGDTTRINYLFPHGLREVNPGEAVGFYCTMQEEVLAGYDKIIFYDDAGESYSAPVFLPAG